VQRSTGIRRNLQDNWCIIDTGMENFAPRWFLSVSPTNTTPLTRRSCQPCMILWIATTMATHSARCSVRGWGSIYLWWYYQCLPVQACELVLGGQRKNDLFVSFCH
jgi:hypothetical protein